MNIQIFLDTETTGKSVEEKHRIVEIGCVKYCNRKAIDKFQIYLNPQRNIDIEAEKVHGLSTEFLADKPIFKDIVNDFWRFITSNNALENKIEILAHNAEFDISFINYELSLINHEIDNIKKIVTVTDTLKLAKSIDPRQRVSLNALCKRYNIDNTHRKLHGALLDAQLLAEVYLAMTGGQNSFMFVDNTKFDVNKIANSNFRVVYAKENELAAHEKFMENISKENANN